MVIQTRFLPPLSTTPPIELPTPITPPMEKLTLLRARMASRKQRLAEAFPEFHSIDKTDCNAVLLVSPARPFKKRCFFKKSVQIEEDKNTIKYFQTTPQDLRNSWLTEDDYKLIGQANKETLIAISRAKGDLSYLNADRICPRGLEDYISQLLFQSHGSTTENHVCKYVRMVLMQHAFQRKCGVNDPESLGRFAAYLSRDSCRKAVRMAKMDSYCCKNAVERERKTPGTCL